MKATTARELLDNLGSDRTFERTGDSSRDKKIVDALVSVGAELSTTALRKVVGKIASSISWTMLFKAARKAPSDPAGELIAKAIGKRSELSAQFYRHAHASGAGAEAAQLVVDMAQSPHLPSLIKRLAKMSPASKAMVAAAKKTLSAKPKKAWFDLVDFLPFCGLLGVLVKSGSPSALKLVDDVAVALERQLGKHEIHEPEATVERIRRGLGAAVAKKTKKKATSKGGASGAANPVVAVAVARGFSVAGKSDWRAKIWLAKGEPNEWFGALQKETQLLMKLNAKSKPHWEVTVRSKTGHKRYSNVAGRVTLDDFGLPPLKRPDDFPAWLGKAAKKLKTSFTPAKAKISSGRQRKLVGELRGWVDGG